MSVLVGDLVVIRRGFAVRRGTSGMKGIVYEAEGTWVHIMWADGRRTARHSSSLEVISGT